MHTFWRIQKLVAAAVTVAVAVLAAAGCSSAHQAVAPPAQAAVVTPATAPTPAPLTCTATVAHRHPADGTNLGVTVSTAPNARITVVAHFQSGSRKKTGRADSAGVRTFWFQVGSATPGYRVKVTVHVSASGQKRSCRASFTPRQPPPPRAPTPSPTPTQGQVPPPSHHHSGAWCTASVKSFMDYDQDEWLNDVYVNSNQPDQDATASGGGDSWSYYTNGSGYADIYLNGPPPGTLITVTVGGATCTTSD